jgi:hypothetical protein
MEDQNKMCSICVKAEPNEYLLSNVCSCDILFHTTCLIKQNEHTPLNKCPVCLDNYKISVPMCRRLMHLEEPKKDTRLFFPFNDFYYHPSIIELNPKPIKFFGMMRLVMAIMYLQVKRVEQLLLEPEILDNLKTCYIGYEPYKQNPIIALCSGTMLSHCNIRFGDNVVKYAEIIIMLLKTNKIDLTEKDAFNKDYKDYIKENNFDFLLRLFDDYET